MSDDELCDAYNRAVLNYEEAKAGQGDRVAAFVEFLSAERVLIYQIADAGGSHVSDTMRCG
jgi:hypothetical protein